MEREMNRLINGLYDNAAQVASLCDVAPSFAQVVRGGIVGAAFDAMIRVSPATDSTIVTVQLPQADVTQGGRAVYVSRTGAFGEVIIAAVGNSLLNGASRLFMFKERGLAEIRFDGQNYYTSYHGALSWGEGI